MQHINGQEEYKVEWSNASLGPTWVQAALLQDHWVLVNAWERKHEVAEVASILSRRVYEGHVMYLVHWIDGV